MPILRCIPTVPTLVCFIFSRTNIITWYCASFSGYSRTKSSTRRVVGIRAYRAEGLLNFSRELIGVRLIQLSWLTASSRWQFLFSLRAPLSSVKRERIPVMVVLDSQKEQNRSLPNERDDEQPAKLKLTNSIRQIDISVRFNVLVSISTLSRA